ncbi:MAG: sensor histidine kinase [Leadbetterella sp.]
MSKKKIFKDLYTSVNTQRWILIILLTVFVIGIMIYYNNVRVSLERTEEKYARLYTESIRFFIEKSENSNCDYGFVQEILGANETVPTILVTDGSPINYLNIPELDDTTRHWTPKEKEVYLDKKIKEMADEHKPLAFDIGKSKGYVYYSNSNIVKQLRYFPYILILTFLIFGFMALVTYSSSRKAEENRVWVGLAKETAHQLGTPISGLVGWIEMLKLNPEFDSQLGEEMLKDVNRLEVITNRFSNIGSEPVKKNEPILEVVESTTNYLKRRISSKIEWSFVSTIAANHELRINRNLIEWVIENLCKNAVDAMEGVGKLSIEISPSAKGSVVIDITDTGKGMSAQVKRKVFSPGFSTKKRGWGLGLTLAKRIIETYHGGQIFVHSTKPGKGTSFRIVL